MSDYFVSAIDPRDRRAQQQMDDLLRQEGIRRDANLDYSCGLYDEDYEIVGTGSCFAGCNLYTRRRRRIKAACS